MHYNRWNRNGHPNRLRGYLSTKGEKNGNYKNGMRGTRIYRIWQNMKNRCRNKNSTSYKWYGGRGIRVCKKWQSFNGFYEDMGDSYFSGASIERQDNRKGYSPDNCVWIRRNRQNDNKSNTLFITAHGRTKRLTEWAEELGKPYHTLYNRLFTYRFPPNDALK